MTPANIARYLVWLYAALALFAFAITVSAAAHRQYGTAVLNAVLTGVWIALLVRLRQRQRPS
jgi:hypothetical protein